MALQSDTDDLVVGNGPFTYQLPAVRRASRDLLEDSFKRSFDRIAALRELGHVDFVHVWDDVG